MSPCKTASSVEEAFKDCKLLWFDGWVVVGSYEELNTPMGIMSAQAYAIIGRGVLCDLALIVVLPNKFSLYTGDGKKGRGTSMALSLGEAL